MYLKHALSCLFLMTIVGISGCSSFSAGPAFTPEANEVFPSTPTGVQQNPEAPTPGLQEIEGLRSTLGADDEGEVATSVIELEDGGFLAAGYDYAGTAGIAQWDALVMRISADGQQVWRRSSDRDGSEYAWVVREGQDGQFVVVGTWEGEDGRTDGYMQRIDLDGNQIWMRTYGGDRDEILWAAEPTPDGGFLLAGQTDSEGAGLLDFYVVRADADGNELWAKTYGTEVTDRAFGIGLSPDGGALIAGFTGKYETTMNFFFVYINRDGNELWRRTISGERFDVAHDVLSLPDGGYMISGYTSSYGPGDHDGFLMRLAPDGRMSWMKTYGDRSDDRILHVTRLQDGGFAMVGYSNWDMVVWRVDANGELLWSHRDEGKLNDQGKDIITARDGSIAAVGGNRSDDPPLEDVILLILGEGAAP